MRGINTVLFSLACLVIVEASATSKKQPARSIQGTPKKITGKLKPLHFKKPEFIYADVPVKSAREPIKIKIRHQSPPTPYIGNDRLAGCLDKTGISRDRYRVFSNEADAKCATKGDGTLLEKQIDNVCIDMQYAGSNAFMSCYYGDDYMNSRRQQRLRSYR